MSTFTSFRCLLIISLLGIAFLGTSRSLADVTVSGISAGAAMAVQMHMAYSKDIDGCSILAGPPFECAGNLDGVTKCMRGPVENISAIDILLKLETYSSFGDIDDLSYIKDDRVYIFIGTLDTVTLPSIVRLNERIYSVFAANIKTNYVLPATHGFPTDNYGESCDVLNMKDFINNCNFSMAYHMLNHLHGGGLVAPSATAVTPLVGQMVAFRQEEFLNPPLSLASGDVSSPNVLRWISHTLSSYNPSDWGSSTSGLFNFTMPTITVPFVPQNINVTGSGIGFDDYGFVYFPSACAKRQRCSIHVAFHGCRQGKRFLGDSFMRKTGYLAVAELNNLIILFPQISPTTTIPYNPMGCWDWWGMNSVSYTIKSAPQMKTVKRMIDTVLMLNEAIANAARSS